MIIAGAPSTPTVVSMTPRSVPTPSPRAAVQKKRRAGYRQDEGVDALLLQVTSIFCSCIWC